MIQHPPWPVLGGGPRISGAVVACALDDAEIITHTPGNGYWTDGVGWDPGYFEEGWNTAFADLIALFELPWGQLRDKLYWYVTAPTDPETVEGAGYLDGAIFFRDRLIEFLNT